MAENRKIPKVPLWRFLMHASDIVKNPLPFHHRNFSKHGDTFRLKIGFNKSVIFSRDAAFAKYCLQKNQRNFTKSPIQTKDLVKYVGKGLLTAEGEHWAKQRKLIQPSFHKKHLAKLMHTVQKTIEEELSNIAHGEMADVFPVFNDLAFQTVVKSLFSNAASRKEINRLQHITEANQQMLVKELRQPFKRFYFRVSGKLQYHLDLSQESRDILLKLVEERKQSGVREGDLLDMLLEARYDDGSAISDEQLIDEILILFVAGHETTSNALTFISELLARHPEVQEKLYEEVQQCESGDIMEQIQSLKYTKQVVEEGMRLYPPAYFIDRVNLEADEYEDYELVPGSTLLFSMYEIHRDPKNWDDPEVFNPDRFADAKKHSSYYFPFGAGPRMCIGNNFAMYEMILAVAHISRNFIIEKKTSAIEINPMITLKPKNAFLKFVARKQ